MTYGQPLSMEKPFLDSTVDNSGNQKTMAETNIEDSKKFSQNDKSTTFVASFN